MSPAGKLLVARLARTQVKVRQLSIARTPIADASRGVAFPLGIAGELGDFF